MTLLTVHDLCSGYGALQVLFGVSLSVGEGEVVALRLGREPGGVILRLHHDHPAEHPRVVGAAILGTHQLERAGLGRLEPRLGGLVGHGVASYSLEECWDDYRFAQLQVPLVAVFGQAYGARTERGDRMFAVMTARSCAAIRDLESFSLMGT